MNEKAPDFYAIHQPSHSQQPQFPLKVRIAVMVLSCALMLLLYSVVHSPHLRYNIAEIFGISSSLFLLFLSSGMIKLVDLEEDLLWLIPVGFFISTYVILKGYSMLAGIYIENLKFEGAGAPGIIAEWFYKNPFIVSVLTLVPFVIAGSSKYDQKTGSVRVALSILIMLIIFWPGMISWPAHDLSHLIGWSVVFYYHLVYVILLLLALPLAIFLSYKGIPLSYLSFDLPLSKRFFLVLTAWVVLLVVSIIIQVITPSFFTKFYSIKEWIVKIVYVTFFISFPMELMFRGLLIGVIKEACKQALGEHLVMPVLFMSSFLFGLIHYGGGSSAIMYSFIYGIIFGVAFLYTRSLLAPILLHTLIDILGPFPF